MDHPQADYLFLSNTADRIWLCVIGILVSIYALYVEVRKEHDPTYRAACDLGEHVSCSRVLTSKYGRGFGFVGFLLGKEHFMNVRNCNLGILFYSLQIIIGMFPGPLPVFVLLLASVISVIGSVYLAIILCVVLKDICIVCITTYIINGSLMYINYQAHTT